MFAVAEKELTKVIAGIRGKLKNMDYESNGTPHTPPLDQNRQTIIGIYVELETAGKFVRSET